MKQLKVHFELKTFQEQIREEIFRIKESWIQDLSEEDRKDNSKLPYALMVDYEMYHKIKQIFLTEFGFVDTNHIYDLRIDIFKEKVWRPFQLVDKEAYLKLK